MSHTKIVSYDESERNIYINDLSMVEPAYGDITDFNGTFIINQPTNSEDDENFYNYENTSGGNVTVSAHFSTILEPGQRLTVKKEGIPKVTKESDSIKVVSSDYTYAGLIDRRTSAIIKKLQDWLKVSQAKVNERDKVIKEKDDIIHDKEIEIEQYRATIFKTEEIIEYNQKKKEGFIMIFKYGIVPYSIFLIISAALFLSAIVLFISWRITGASIFNPAGLFMLIIMSFGWGITALVGIINLLKRSDNYDNN